jgi:hypothetical protein
VRKTGWGKVESYRGSTVFASSVGAEFSKLKHTRACSRMFRKVLCSCYTDLAEVAADDSKTEALALDIERDRPSKAGRQGSLHENEAANQSSRAQQRARLEQTAAREPHHPECPLKHTHRVWEGGGGGSMGFVYETHNQATLSDEGSSSTLQNALQATWVPTPKGGWSVLDSAESAGRR